jgi:ABC-type polar amino acid transport system ATPase subunit
MNITIGPSTLNVDGRPLLSFEKLVFESGNVYCIRGRSGTGKTSFLRALRASNSVSVSGVSPYYSFENHQPPIAAPRLGVDISILQQSSPLWPHISALSNTWLPWASQHGIKKTFRRRDEAMRRARAKLSKLGLDPSVWNRKPLSLSGGERQRVALAAVLVFDTPCVLLDEPTSSLDRISIGLVSAMLLDEASRGKLIIVTSHDVDFLENKKWRHLTIENQTGGPSQFSLHEVAYALPTS